MIWKSRHSIRKLEGWNAGQQVDKKAFYLYPSWHIKETTIDTEYKTTDSEPSYPQYLVSVEWELSHFNLYDNDQEASW